MRLNDDKIGRDMLKKIVIPECPTAFRKEAENLVDIMNILPLGRDYHSVTELDKILTWRYWVEVDGLKAGNAGLDWYLKTATPPDTITRARRWLVENRYFILKSDVAEAAQEAAVHYRAAVKSK